MNVLLWVLQILLALHTLVGAMWKTFSPEQTVPSLSAIPHALWLALAGLEVLCAVGLTLPALDPRRAALAPVAATFIAAEMLLFTAVAYASGGLVPGEAAYWLVVAAVAAFIAYGRLVVRPVSAAEA